MSDYGQPIRIRPPEQDAAGNVETPLSPDEVRVAIREGWSHSTEVLVVQRMRVEVINFADLAPARAVSGAAA